MRDEYRTKVTRRTDYRSEQADELQGITVSPVTSVSRSRLYLGITS